ncbi:MAG: ribonuclease III [Actinomycetota bacterium]|nr:ribonuclease III [Actinomycetota bacterium]
MEGERGSGNDLWPTFKSRLGIECSPDLLEVALTHRSYAFERRDVEHNERLEFLGDAVLGLAVTDLIYRWFPDLPEGEMAKLRSSTVNMAALAESARSIELGLQLRLGRGEELSGGRDKPSILADAFEAVVGAVYLDCGWEKAYELVERLFAGRIREHVEQGVVRDFKTNLQEVLVQLEGALPEYRVSSSGPDHAKTFRATVLVRGTELGTGNGRSKKEAEQAAAEQALLQLDQT